MLSGLVNVKYWILFDVFFCSLRSWPEIEREEREASFSNYWTLIETSRKYNLQLERGKKLRGRWTTKLQVAYPELSGISMSHPREHLSPPGPRHLMMVSVARGGTTKVLL